VSFAGLLLPQTTAAGKQNITRTLARLHGNGTFRQNRRRGGAHQRSGAYPPHPGWHGWTAHQGELGRCVACWASSPTRWV